MSLLETSNSIYIVVKDSKYAYNVKLHLNFNDKTDLEFFFSVLPSHPCQLLWALFPRRTQLR